ncbi:unnamed protein product [Meganyctiphanes norvegica]|uniref:Broad-complex n=1 Tax=Meganyctiphanes norvegica TaxID=48144 RepID=A0AAV2QL56_MEGNR
MVKEARMGAHQQFCLRWNDFHTNISAAFVSLREDEEFVDITLACEGKQVKAHKMVLSACSPYFKSLLTGNPCQHPIVFLKDVTFANLKLILDFMYHGEVNVPHSELGTFIKIAKALKVKGLAQDEKKNESESHIEACSPLSTREPSDPGLAARLRQEVDNAPDTHITAESPPPKRLRRHSREPTNFTEEANEMVQGDNREYSVKNESLDLTDANADFLISDDTKNIKQETDDNSEEREFVSNNSETINQNQSAMQTSQKPFGSFLHDIGQIPDFLPHGATFNPRPPVFLPERVQGLVPRIMTLSGLSMPQDVASLNASKERDGRLECPHCDKRLKGDWSLQQHIEDIHTVHLSTYECNICQKQYKTQNSLKVHVSKYHNRNRQYAIPVGSNQAEQIPIAPHHETSRANRF